MPTTIAYELRDRALRVVYALNTDEPSHKLVAIKALRDYDGAAYSLREYKDAVEWALARPGADSLPVGTVVATGKSAYVKEESSTDSGAPWASTSLDGPVTDDEIDVLLRASRANVLRVGTGGNS